MEFPETFDDPAPIQDPPKHIMSESSMEDDHARTATYADDVAPMPAAQDRAAADVISLEAVRSALVSNFESNDLDVPAFLRKRNDVM